MADKLATRAVVERLRCWVVRKLPKDTKAIWGGFDGGKRGINSGMGFWIAAGIPVSKENEAIKWTLVSMACVPLYGSVPEAERMACQALTLCAMWQIQQLRNEKVDATMKSYNALKKIIGCEAGYEAFPVNARIQRTLLSYKKEWTVPMTQSVTRKTPVPVKKVGTVKASKNMRKMKRIAKKTGKRPALQKKLLATAKKASTVGAAMNMRKMQRIIKRTGKKRTPQKRLHATTWDA